MKSYGRTDKIKKDDKLDSIIDMLIECGAPVINSNPIIFDTINFDVYEEINLRTREYCYIWAVRENK